MKALVTGGAGLIGSHIADALVAAGHDVVILDSLDPLTHPSAGWPEWSIRSGARLEVGDVRDWAAVRRAIDGCDVVFHQAAFGGFAPDAARRMLDVNAVGTAVVMQEAARADVERVVVASSQAVFGHGHYVCSCGWEGPGVRELERLEAREWEPACPKRCGDTPAPVRLSPDTPVNLPTPYAISKYAAETVALLRGNETRIVTTALRYALTYGPRQSASNPYTGIVSIFSGLLREGREPVVYEDGHQTRDLTFVTDVAAANLLVAEADPMLVNGRVFTVGTGIPTPVSKVVLELAGLHRMLPMAIGGSGRYRPGDARHVVTDPSALVELGWKPLVTAQEGLLRHAEWFRGLPPLPSAFDAAERLLRADGIVRG